VTDTYERDESKFVTTPETKYKNIAPTLPVDQEARPMDGASTKPKYDYNKASKKMKKRKTKTSTSDGMSTPTESVPMHTSESAESAISVRLLEKQLQVSGINIFSH
jgi:hypothetical protein